MSFLTIATEVVAQKYGYKFVENKSSRQIIAIYYSIQNREKNKNKSKQLSFLYS